MPTPFYHIRIALDILNQLDLPPETRHLLNDQRCSFFFGNTAPDVQIITGQPREETHFFCLPIHADQTPAWETFLHVNPAISNPGSLPDAQKAFFCGYLCHLQADWYWQVEIFEPAFGPSASWDTFQRRLFLHNVLRTYLDLKVYSELPNNICRCIGDVDPTGWLPFTADLALKKWRDILSQQFLPGASPRTVEVFAERQKISPEEYYRLVKSEEDMQHKVFAHISKHELQLFHQKILVQNLQLILSFMNGYWDQTSCRIE